MQAKGARIIAHSSLLLPELESGSVRLIFESPPFEKMNPCCHDPDCLACYQGEAFVERFARFLPERLRVLSDGGSYILNFQPQVLGGFLSPSEHLLPAAVIAAGFKHVETHIWHKPNASPMVPGQRLKNSFEFFWHFAKGQGYYFDKDAVREPHLWKSRDNREDRYHPNGKDPGNVFVLSKSNDQKEYDHPGKMREGIAGRFIRLLTAPGELVVDGFAGTGQTGVEALALGRTFAGYEIHDERAEAARKRLGPAEAQGDEPMKTWMSAQEVADYSGLSISTIYSKTSRGEVPVHRGCGKPRYHKDEIDAWMRGENPDGRDNSRKAAQTPVDTE